MQLLDETPISGALKSVVSQALQQKLTDGPETKPETVRYLSADKMSQSLKLATEMPSNWAVMPPSENYKLVPISQAAEPDLWASVEARLAESLPDFRLSSIERVQV